MIIYILKVIIYTVLDIWLACVLKAYMGEAETTKIDSTGDTEMTNVNKEQEATN